MTNVTTTTAEDLIGVIRDSSTAQGLGRRKEFVEDCLPQPDGIEQTERILFTLAKAIEQRDHTTGVHCDRVAHLSVALGLALGLGWEDLESLYRGGYLHDIGKVGMPDRVLCKAGPLNEEEWQIMKTHPVRGEEICKPMRFLGGVLPIIRSHHERW